MSLPVFKYHPDPLKSGSVAASDEACRCCGQARGYVYTGPVYSAEDLGEALCPWCIADGSAAEKLDAEFVDAACFPDDTPEAALEEITRRTPGYSAWQGEQWPACCGDAAAFLQPAGIEEIRRDYRELEGALMGHIVYELEISGGAATRLLGSLNRDKGPTVYLFRCLACAQYHFHIDQP